MVFRLAIAGSLPEDQQLFQQVEGILTRLREELMNPQEVCRLRILVSHPYTGTDWMPLAVKHGESICGFSTTDTSDWDTVCDRILREDTTVRSHLGEELCDSADLLIMTWDEDPASRDGSCWELLQIAHKRGIPCVWISTESGKVFWAEESFFEICQPEHLRQLGAMFREENLQPEIPEGKRILFLKLGMALRRRFMGRYKAQGKPVQPRRDDLLQADSSVEAVCSGGEELRLRLLNAFTRFDKAAIEMNQRYQGVIYWRAILPFITSVFLALGFYAENVFGIIPGTNAGFWTVVAGFGFLIHGLLNLYVYQLSRSETIRSWHEAYLNNRYVAELLRVLIHFAPYGVQLNLRKLCQGNDRIYMTARRLLGEEIRGQQKIGAETSAHMLEHLERLLEDQIAYHAQSQIRYQRIVKKLDAWHRSAFIIGFVAVLLRAVFQAVLALWPITSGSLNGVPLQKFAGSFANMLALMLPGWASYFATKLDLCNFRYNAENHGRMVERLSGVLSRVRNMREGVARIPLEALNTLGEEVAEIMILEDTYVWYGKFRGATVKHL